MPHNSHHTNDNFSCVDYKILKTSKTTQETTVYMWVLYEEYSYDGALKVESGAHIPTVITAKRDGIHYALKEYWTPRDGSLFAKDIKEKFPMYLWNNALDSQKYIKEQKAYCLTSAQNYFSTSSDKNIVSIIDRTKQQNISTDQALEIFYSDDEYDYYFPSIKNQYVIVTFADGSAKTVKDALSNNDISIQNLDEFGIEYLKQEKKHQFFRAEILEVNEKSILVKPDADSIETNIADKIYVSLDVTSSIPVPTLKVGDRVHIIHRGNILETYPAQIQDPYVIYLLSDSGEILSPTPKKTYSPMIIDKTSFDIDGDGIKEDCILTYGPTSGLFTFEFYVSENGIDEYFNIYNTEFYHLTFIEEDGILKVKGITQGENPQTYIFDISIKDKNIILSNNGVKLSYWGEQGVNSKYR